MVLTQDDLVTLPQSRYGEYLSSVYRRMAAFVPHNAHVMEVGVRPEDRGVLSRQVIPHRLFTCVDKNRQRAVAAVASQDPRSACRVCDVLTTVVQADVILSTCVLHHTVEGNIPLLLGNLHADTLLFSGPNVVVLPELFGDHLWHIDITKLFAWLVELHYVAVWAPSGLTAPLSEVFVVAKKMGI